MTEHMTSMLHALWPTETLCEPKAPNAEIRQPGDGGRRALLSLLAARTLVRFFSRAGLTSRSDPRAH